MSLVMQIPQIKGNVTIKGLENSILIHAYTLDSERLVHQRTGVVNDGMGVVQLKQLHLTKAVDQSSVKLAQLFLQGKTIPEVTITQFNLNSGYPEWHHKLVLSNVRIANLKDFMDSNGATEKLTFAFSKIEKSYRSQFASGNWQTPEHAAFDIPTAKVG